MAARNKPYEQFGPYILFKKLEQDSLGDLWRAGRMDQGQIAATVALRRLGAGNRAALTASADAAARILPQLAGTSFARDQVAQIIDGIPCLAWDYAGGRSLRHIIDRARGGKDVPPNPLPIDQAIVIAEKVALSLTTTAELRDGSNGRLSHGALLPQFIWISDDGEIRVAGQQMAAGILASLADPNVAAEIGRYFAPELRTSGQAPKNADVYSMGAVLFLLITGQEPPDAMTASAFVAAVRAAKTTTGAPVPDDIRIVLDKSFNLDPSMRFASIADMKQAVSALAHGGKYSATTFNLAFYLSNLLKKDMETEALERDKESKLNLAPYLEVPRPAAAAAPSTPSARPESAAPIFAATAPAPKSRMPMFIAAAVALVAALGVGGWMWISKSTDATAATATAAQMVKPAVPAQKPLALPAPIISTPAATETQAAAVDPEAQKKAFEAAVAARLQAEMMKLQNDYMSELKKQQSRNAPVNAPQTAAAPAPAIADERPAMSAAQLDLQRREAARQEEAAALPAPTQTAAPAAQPAAQLATTQTTAPAPAPVQAAAVREGDVVDIAELDALPRPTRPINAVYPPIARQQRISATVIVSALIDENGEVQQVKVLKGIGRFGIDESAQRALRTARFTPPMKDGKRVKTWYPQTIAFQP